MDNQKDQLSKGLGSIDVWVTEKIATRPLLSYLIGILAVVIICFLMYILNIEPVVRREVIMATNLSQIWTQETSLHRSFGSFGDLFLEIEKECVLLVAQPGFLHCLNPMTGETKWQNRVNRSGDITIHDNTIFLAFSNGSRHCGDPFTPHCESIGITAYHIDSGKEIWSEIYTGMLWVTQMTADDFLINIGGGGGHGYYGSRMVIEAPTGDLLNYQELESPHSPPFSTPSPDFIVEKEETVRSNVVLEDGVYYFYTDDSVLWAVDEITKTVIATVEFSQYEPHHFAGLAAQGNVVLIYFNDNQQLYAFQVDR